MQNCQAVTGGFRATKNGLNRSALMADCHQTAFRRLVSDIVGSCPPTDYLIGLVGELRTSFDRASTPHARTHRKRVNDRPETLARDR
jgi:hypothetical protein